MDFPEKENNKEDFDKAWEHPYMNNPHHWDYWWHRSQPMPTIFIIEITRFSFLVYF